MPHESQVTTYTEPGLYLYLRPRWSSAVVIDLVGGTGGASSDGQPGQPGRRERQVLTGEELQDTYWIAVYPGGSATITATGIENRT